MAGHVELRRLGGRIKLRLCGVDLTLRRELERVTGVSRGSEPGVWWASRHHEPGVIDACVELFGLVRIVGEGSADLDVDASGRSLQGRLL